MHRRTLVSLPALSLLSGWSADRASGPDWRDTVGELRFGHFVAPREDSTLSEKIGVPVRHVSIGFEVLVDAVDRGHIEFGQSPWPRERAMLRARMGDRLVWGGYNNFILRSLPRTMRDDIMDVLRAG